jgi:hypothetical protein
MKFDTLEKARRVLPSFAFPLLEKSGDLGALRRCVRIERDRIKVEVLEAMAATHSGYYATPEIKEMQRRHLQLDNFLNITGGTW